MDVASAGKMVALLGRVRAASRTIVLTTHQRSLAEPLADYLLTMEAGQLISRSEGPALQTAPDESQPAEARPV
jgi:ABC-type multidrug transport system ATPase subunit